MKKVLMWITV